MAAKTSRPQASGFLGLGLTTLSVDPRLAARCRRELETMAPRLSELSRSTCNPLSRHLWLRFEDDTPTALAELFRRLAALPGAIEKQALAANLPCPRRSARS